MSETEIVHLLDSARDALTADNGMIVVQRLRAGSCASSASTGSSSWTARSAKQALRRAFVAQILRAVLGAPRPTLEAILAFCVHDIGPAPRARSSSGILAAVIAPIRSGTSTTASHGSACRRCH